MRANERMSSSTAASPRVARSSSPARSAIAWIGVVLLAACQGAIGGPVDDDPRDPVDPTDPIDADAPIRESVGGADLDDARRVRRLTADQIARSLEVATGQTWRDYDRFAGALGKPDLAEVTDEGLSVSVAFAKLVEDGARATCDAAVNADVDRPAAERVILRHAGPDDASFESHVENLRYLLLRFWAVEVTEPTDERLVPWLGLLSAPRRDGEELTNADRLARWKAVCVGLATHPDFLTY